MDTIRLTRKRFEELLRKEAKFHEYEDKEKEKRDPVFKKRAVLENFLDKMKKSNG